VEALTKYFDGCEVRIIFDDSGNPWWVARDACEAIGLSKYRDAIARLADDERGSARLDTLGGPQEMATINEPGLYALILGCVPSFADSDPRKDEKTARVRRFKTWVTHEVLPSIRKTGSYSAPAAPQTLEQRALGVIADLKALCETQAAQLVEAKPKVEFVDRYVEATGLTTLSNAAKELGLGPRKFIGWLCALGVLFHQGGRIVAAQGLIDRGLFADRTGVADNGHKYGQVYLTPKGMAWAAEKWRASLGTQLTLAAEVVS
jgi:anti-repressor protein